jgi:hypothetical protein
MHPPPWHRLCCVSRVAPQATLTAALAALTNDIDTVGPSTYYGTTDAYRRQVAASLLYKVRAVGGGWARLWARQWVLTGGRTGVCVGVGVGVLAAQRGTDSASHPTQVCPPSPSPSPHPLPPASSSSLIPNAQASHSPPPPSPVSNVQLFIRALPSSSVTPAVLSAGLRYIRPVSSETNTYTPDPSEAPVSEPVIKLGALKQVCVSV